MLTRPRLLVTTSTLPRWPGDSEARFVLDLARHLLLDFSVTVLAPAYPGAALEDSIEGVRVLRYRYGPTRGVETLCNPGAVMSRLRENPLLWALVPGLFAGLHRAVAHQIAAGRVNCVHAHWFVPQGLVHVLQGRRPGAPPFVVTSHGGDMMLAEHALMRPLLRRVLNAAAAVTVVSPALCADIARLDPGYDCSRLRVIPMGVDLDRFTVRADPVPCAESARPVRVLFVGRLTEKKGVEYLLEALARPPLAAAQVELWIVGDGPLRAALEARSEALALSQRVRFLGGVPHSRLEHLYRECDVFCAPSVLASDGDRDGMPTVLCEAAASGLPLVGTRCGGLPLMVLPDETGLLCRPRDADDLAHALARLVADPALRQRMGAAAAEHVRRYSWVRIARQYAETFEYALRARAAHAVGASATT